MANKSKTSDERLLQAKASALCLRQNIAVKVCTRSCFQIRHRQNRPTALLQTHSSWGRLTRCARGAKQNLGPSERRKLAEGIEKARAEIHISGEIASKTVSVLGVGFRPPRKQKWHRFWGSETDPLGSRSGTGFRGQKLTPNIGTGGRDSIQNLIAGSSQVQILGVNF